MSEEGTSKPRIVSEVEAKRAAGVTQLNPRPVARLTQSL